MPSVIAEVRAQPLHGVTLSIEHKAAQFRKWNTPVRVEKNNGSISNC